MDEELLGTVKLTAIDYVPEGYEPCNGKLLQINQEQAMFALLGIRFGGDGRSNFALPKLDSPFENLHYIICTRGMWPSRP